MLILEYGRDQLGGIPIQVFSVQEGTITKSYKIRVKDTINVDYINLIRDTLVLRQAKKPLVIKKVGIICSNTLTRLYYYQYIIEVR